MTKCWIQYEELWQRWEIDRERPTYQNGAPKHCDVHELPDELVERFQAAKKEMEDVWAEIGQIILEEER